MYNEQEFNRIKQALRLARQRHKLDPRDTMETQIYIAHVEHLLIELDCALTMNHFQVRNIRAYLAQHRN
jgi:hypothetical protein